jgi:hypothetical protein
MIRAGLAVMKKKVCLARGLVVSRRSNKELEKEESND